MKVKKRQDGQEENIFVQMGKFEMVIDRRYRVLSWLNDFLLGVLYLTGSILFLTNAGRLITSSFYLAGSIMMVSRAVLNILKDLHLKKIRSR